MCVFEYNNEIMIRRFFLTLLMTLPAFFLQAGNKQKPSVVPDNLMQKIYEEVKTPFKYGLIMVPPDDSKKLDCPSVFRKEGQWFMTYLVYDGRGYETWLAESNDLLNWKSKGRIMSFSSDTTRWDCNQKAGYTALQDYKWEGSYELERYDNKYWMTYIGGGAKGYEVGALSIGLATTEENPATVHEWSYLQKPVLTATDREVRWWENRKLYKSTVIWDKTKTTGHPFVMFYNANGDSAKNNLKTRWYERIGMAVSDNMVDWKRTPSEPLVYHSMGITGDPVIRKIGDLFVMFYFGAFWEGRKDAFNRFACSYDLVHWTDWNGKDLISCSEPYDNLYAHKSFVVKWKGVVYHFYCAVNKKDQRGIAVATSSDTGKSNIEFIEGK
jgi:predicted GH43/DUF377 family glycosyl hydrolase